LNTSAKEVEKYERVAKAYGNVVPAIVGQNGKAYHILSGQARLEACVHRGIEEIPVIIAEVSEEAEQMKLALLLSTVREEGGALSEGAFIDMLLTRHGVTRRELMGLLKKSKSWISKRQSLSLRLSENVKWMVKDRVICARTAEEIAKLPEEVQVTFASNVVRDGLSKSSAGQLVSLYMRSESNSALRDAILDSPLSVLDAYPTGTVVRRIEKRGLVERIAGNARFVIRMIYEIKDLLAKADTQSLTILSAYLDELRMVLADMNTVINVIFASVLPGKQNLQGGDVS
jgi:ParB-like chromosome segregation protein Spo0J